MKRSYKNTEETAKFNAFDALKENEMIQVRGGADTKPRSRDKDIFDLD
jgi:hypothetical protein